MDAATISVLVSALAFLVSVGGVLYARRSTMVAERSEEHAKRAAESAERSALAEESALAIERERAIVERLERGDRGAPDWRVRDIVEDGALGYCIRLLNRGGTGMLVSARVEGVLWFSYCECLIDGVWVEMPMAEDRFVGHLEEVVVGVPFGRLDRGASLPARSAKFMVFARTREGAYSVRTEFSLTDAGGPFGGARWRASEPKVEFN